MADKLRKEIVLETAFGTYTLYEQLGIGGAGTVYGGNGPAGDAVAVKVLRDEAASSDKRRRFKNEIAFLQRCNHPNIVQLLDHGFSSTGPAKGPFYVMRRFDGSLRDLMKNNLLPAAKVLALYEQVLHGIEAAHLLGAVHRDLKPENILWDSRNKSLAVADFGVADLSADLAVTAVETKPQQRLANFIYAAPEQRIPGRETKVQADIFALGMMLNELFTGEVPHGQGYRTIGLAAPEYGHLDDLVATMLSQEPARRPQSVAHLKRELSARTAALIAQQELRKIDQTVVRSDEVNDPLAQTAPTLIDADWDNGKLTLKLDKPITEQWAQCLKYRMGNFTSIMGKGPEQFILRGNEAVINAGEHEIRDVIGYFKKWLPIATAVYRQELEHAARQKQDQLEGELKARRAIATKNARVAQSLKDLI